MLKLRGFTLFTALVGFVVISISLLVIQHMSNSEQNYTQIIVGMKNQSEMEAIKDVLRLESFNIFNLLLRAKIFQYFTMRCGDIRSCAEGELSLDAYPIDYSVYKQDSGLQIAQKNLETYMLFRTGDPLEDPTNVIENAKIAANNPFAGFLAIGISNNVYNFSGQFRNKYNFKVYNPQAQAQLIDNSLNNPAVNSDIFSENYQSSQATQTLAIFNGTAFVNSRLKGSIMKIINCSDKTNCNDGTFYINADFTTVSDDIYFNIPRMFLYNTEDFSAIDDAIIPKAHILFYVPFRLFAAMNFAGQAIERTSANRTTFENRDYGSVNLDNGPNTTVIQNDNGLPKYNSQDVGLKFGNYAPDDFLTQTDLCQDLIRFTNSQYVDLRIVDCKIMEANLKATDIWVLNSQGSPHTLQKQKISNYSILLTIADNSKQYWFGGEAPVYLFRYQITPENDPQYRQSCEYTLDQSQNWVRGNCTQLS